jgi:hypothetical protein
MSLCRHTGLSRPECSCFACLTDQIRRFRPGLLDAEPVAEIQVARQVEHGTERRRAA